MTTPPPSAGWYAAPDGSSGQRYRDGESWTSFGFDPQLTSSEHRPLTGVSSTARYRRLALWFSLAAVAIIVVVIVGLAISSAVKSPDHDGGQATRVTQPEVTSTVEAWLTTICKPGTLMDEQVFPGATTSGACLGKREPVLTFYGKYSSKFRIDNDLAT